MSDLNVLIEELQQERRRRSVMGIALACALVAFFLLSMSLHFRAARTFLVGHDPHVLLFCSQVCEPVRTKQCEEP